MKNSQLLVLITLALTSTLSFSVFAGSNDPTDKERVVLESCMSLKSAPEEHSANSCVHYIQGFLAGSLTTKSDYVLRETSGEFFDRAYQTRVGKRTSKEQPTQLCLPKNVNVEHLAERLVGHLSYPIESMQLLHTQIFDALALESSCS
ncbi:hypothetical protein FM038_019805 [Shewanella eurypsychrophilus]|uniref:Rap1a immunity protein domain-containing protein n=1 Tax=Shewanella eurypsychrophilus TaxID=2593656 RepID=A0ABX6VC37_9GAMM|nr:MULTISPECIES: hypothetical protein [Shewanella]QFU24172.1 hypothetical protein FS418_21530 [Shewanella sp. YLB-09]QPG59378.1 hypothetical protein FM038_019805 [Shewanella eurypsychrophilus]